MMSLTANRILALFLGVWIALAPAAFAMPAAAMTVQTSMSGDAWAGGYDCCPEGDMERGPCALMCFNATLLATVPELGTLSSIAREEQRPARHPALLGRLSTPDPAPPKAVSLL
jgi:hypothetical protein